MRGTRRFWRVNASFRERQNGTRLELNRLLSKFKTSTLPLLRGQIWQVLCWCQGIGHFFWGRQLAAGFGGFDRQTVSCTHPPTDTKLARHSRKWHQHGGASQSSSELLHSKGGKSVSRFRYINKHLFYAMEALLPRHRLARAEEPAVRAVRRKRRQPNRGVGAFLWRRGRESRPHVSLHPTGISRVDFHVSAAQLFGQEDREGIQGDFGG